jgi:two-component system sensor histidine kinase KdpD
MEFDRLSNARRLSLSLTGTSVALVAASGLVAYLEGPVGVPNASSAYLLAVLLSAMAFGTVAGIVAAVGAFLLYDFLFVAPLYTFTVGDPGEWLNLILLLVGGILVGQLAAAQRSRAEAAVGREREARALFQVSRALSIRPGTIDVLPEIASILRTEASMERVWIGLARPAAPERIVADTGGVEGTPSPTASHALLRRMPGETPAQWVLVHQPTRARGPARSVRAYRVQIDAAGHNLGSLWALRARSAGQPESAPTRLLAAAADQVGQALEQDRLAGEARTAEIARQSDALKTALLESVSHDLRTPLATIRAAAGTMLDRQLEIPAEDRRASALAIDREAEHLNRLVTNLLDLSRIQAGALRADLEPLELSDAILPIVARLHDRLDGRTLEIDLAGAGSPALVDAVFFDQIVTNLLENAAKYVPAGERVRIRATETDGRLRLTVEDSGPGAPPEALPRLFERFYRVQGGTTRSRPGTGVGLAVVRGLAEAMGGRVAARPSDLGGLAIDVDLPVAPDQPVADAGGG